MLRSNTCVTVNMVITPLGWRDNSKRFEDKLVGMKIICRNNIQTASRDIYGISLGAIPYHVEILLWQIPPSNLYVFLTDQTVHGWGSDEYDYTPLVSFGKSGSFPFS